MTDPIDLDKLRDSLPRGMFYPLAIYMTKNGGEWLVRDYAGQSGRFCVVGPWTTDILCSYPAFGEACEHIEKYAGPGCWFYRRDLEKEASKP